MITHASAHTNDSPEPLAGDSRDLAPIAERNPNGQKDVSPDQTYRDAIIDERARMSREIHDTLAQNFIGILLQLEAAELTPEYTMEFIDRIRQLAQDGVIQSRKSIEQLRDATADETSFDTTLRLLLHRFCGGTLIDYHVIVEGSISRIRPEETIQLRSMVLESIVNAVRHAKPNLIEITVDCRQRPWSVFVRDNGCGMEPQQIESPRLGQGIANMRTRACLINAQLLFHSQPGQGTVVTITGPA